MPLYEYQCMECGLRFEKVRPFAERKGGASCPSCSKTAPRAMPKTVSSMVDVAVTGPVPQNTGYADLDAHIDRVIGQSAKQGWAYQEGRAHEKEEVIRDSGFRPGERELYREPDGTWRVMSPEEEKASFAARDVNRQAMTILSRRKRKLSSAPTTG